MLKRIKSLLTYMPRVLDFREYTLKGKHSFTLKVKKGKGFVKAT
jgi:hypothetical protein